jgi:uncharacterized protein (DUF1015 family)
MTNVLPFPGIRYNKDIIDNLASVISPPYDNISAEDRKRLWHQHDNNVVRLILPPPGDSDVDVVTQSTNAESDDWYQSAAAHYRDWRKNGVLQTDPCQFYVYRQTYTYMNQPYTRTGLFVSLKLDDNDAPLSHERTFDGPKADRLRLMSAAESNPSPLFLISDGEYASWDGCFSKVGEPLVSFNGFDGQKHELLPVSDADAVQTIQQYVNGLTLVIADGHHRYETAQNYKRKMMEQTGKDPDNQPWGGVMALIVPMSSPGLLVLPTHRVLKEIPDGWMEQIKSKAAPYCDIEELTDCNGSVLCDMLAQPEHQETIVVIGADRSLLIKLKHDVEPPSLKALDAPLRRLNVSILHNFIFETCLGLTADDLQSITKYVRGEENAISLVKKGDAQAAFLLGGLSPQTVYDVSQHNVRMPQKSTDFYPKIPTGLLFRSVESE